MIAAVGDYMAKEVYETIGIKAKILYSENRFNSISSKKIIEKEKQNEQEEFEKLLD